MSYKEKDILLKTLAEKIAQAKPEAPTPQDWESFQEAYAMHKLQKKENKKRLILWWVLTFIGTLTTLAFFYVTQIENKSLKKGFNISKEQQEKQVIKAEEKPSVQIEKVKITQVKGYSKMASKIRFKPKQKVQEKMSKPIKRNGNGKIETEISTESFQASIKDIFTVAPKYKMLHLHDSYNMKALLLQPISLPLARNFSNSVDSVNAKNNRKVRLTSPKNIYLELGGLAMIPSFQTAEMKPIKQSFGLGLHGGIFLNPHWSIATGLQVGFGTSHEEFLKKEIVKEIYIERIDTNIKYNVQFNRLMMQIDTVKGVRDVEVTRTSVLHHQLQSWSIPLQLRYHVGNEKRNIFMSAGLQSNFFVHSFSVVQNKGTKEETSTLKREQFMLFAPSVGFGLNQHLFKSCYANGTIQYQQFLGKTYQNSNQLQFQLGIMYQLK